jgi:hypothetical protein
MPLQHRKTHSRKCSDQRLNRLNTLGLRRIKAQGRDVNERQFHGNG